MTSQAYQKSRYANFAFPKLSTYLLFLCYFPSFPDKTGAVASLSFCDSPRPFFCSGPGSFFSAL